MRKLTRKNLDELAKVMPVISANVKSQYIGGAVYFDTNGNRLGNLGSSDEIRVITKELFDQYTKNGGENTELDELGTSFKDSSGSIQRSIIQDYINQYASEVTSFELSNMTGNIATVSSKGELTLKISSISNEYELISTLQHENYHLSTVDDWLSSGNSSPSGVLNDIDRKNKNELETLMWQISQDEFKNTSLHYRSQIAESIYQTWQNLRMYWKTREDAMELCNANYSI